MIQLQQFFEVTTLKYFFQENEKKPQQIFSSKIVLQALKSPPFEHF